MNPNDEILAALDAFADRAPHPDRIMRTLNGRIRRHRQRRALLAAGTVAVGTAAVGVPAFFWLRSPGTDAPTGNLPVPTPEPSPGAGNLRAPMLLRPTWLPEGVSEMTRDGRVGAAYQMRVWASPEFVAAAQAGDGERAARSLNVSLQVNKVDVPVQPTSWPSSSPPPTEEFNPLVQPANITIGGHPGFIGEPEASGVQVKWLLDGGLLAELWLSAGPDASETALRIARSVVPDKVAGAEVAMGFGWLPDTVAPRPVYVKVYGWERQWSQRMEVRSADLDSPYQVDATLTTQLGRDTGESWDKVTVRGRSGQISSGAVIVQLEDGNWLRIQASQGPDGAKDRTTMLRIAEELRLGPAAYLGWIGTR